MSCWILPSPSPLHPQILSVLLSKSLLIAYIPFPSLISATTLSPCRVFQKPPSPHLFPCPLLSLLSSTHRVPSPALFPNAPAHTIHLRFSQYISVLGYHVIPCLPPFLCLECSFHPLYSSLPNVANFLAAMRSSGESGEDRFYTRSDSLGSRHSSPTSQVCDFNLPKLQFPLQKNGSNN